MNTYSLLCSIETKTKSIHTKQTIMEALQIFSSPKFGQVRTVKENGKLLFGATDVASALGYSNPRDAIARHCKSNGVVNHDVIDSMGRQQQVKFINEGNIVRLVTSSKLPQAEQFESWIFDELVPTVIKSGGYMIARQDETPEEVMARALNIAQETLKRREERISSLEHKALLQEKELQISAPKVKYVDEVLQSASTYTATQLGKEMGFTSAESLNRKLKEMGIHFKQSGQWMLTAKHCGKGYTKTRTQTFTRSDGSTGTNTITVWTEAGRLFIHELLNNQKI